MGSGPEQFVSNGLAETLKLISKLSVAGEDELDNQRAAKRLN